MAEIKFNYAIYHSGCIDGFTGFFVAHNSGKLTKDLIIYPDTPSAEKYPPNIKDKDIIIIDVAYKKNILEEIFKRAKSVVFIDHHHSTIEDVRELQKKYNNVKIVYDENRSGATLTWKYFYPRQVAPLFLKYVEDQDTGRWECENTKPFILALKANFHLSTEGKSLNKWFRLLNKQNVVDLIEEGKMMQKYVTHLVNVNIPKHTLHKFPSQKVYDKFSSNGVFKKAKQYTVALFCGLGCPSVTELSNEALKKIDCDFVIMWRYDLIKMKYIMSMRSTNIDVSEICKLFGGGGHKYAAACSIDKKMFDIDDMFERLR